MSTTASRVYLTQSTVSKRLAALDRELGTRLFEWGKGKQQMTPTAAGEEFFEVAERMLTLYAQAIRVKARSITAS